MLIPRAIPGWTNKSSWKRHWGGAGLIRNVSVGQKDQSLIHFFFQRFNDVQLMYIRIEKSKRNLIRYLLPDQVT